MQKEINNLQQNQVVLTQKQQEIILSNGLIAHQTGVLKLKQQGLFDLFPELKKELQLLGVKRSQVESIANTTFGQDKSFYAPLQDSVSIVTNAANTSTENGPHSDTFRYKTFRYHDAFYDVSGIADDSLQTISISSRDTLTQVVYQRRKHPLLWIFSQKILEQRIYFKNPNAHIYFSRFINIEK